MKIKKIILNNIRSYEDQEVNFPDGSVLLSGDIGSGKTSILLGIEFALFGLQPGQKGASILRKILIKGPIGVSKLRIFYGNRKNMGMAPEHFVIAGGNIIRKLLQQLEKAGLAKQTEKGVHKGRILTPKGISLLDKTAAEILKDNPPEKLQLPEEIIIIKEKKVEPLEQPKPKRVFEKRGRPKPRRDSYEKERSPRKSQKR